MIYVKNDCCESVIKQCGQKITSRKTSSCKLSKQWEIGRWKCYCEKWEFSVRLIHKELTNSYGPIPCLYLKQINIQETFEVSWTQNLQALRGLEVRMGLEMDDLWGFFPTQTIRWFHDSLMLDMNARIQILVSTWVRVENGEESLAQSGLDAVEIFQESLFLWQPESQWQKSCCGKAIPARRQDSPKYLFCLLSALYPHPGCDKFAFAHFCLHNSFLILSRNHIPTQICWSSVEIHVLSH